MKTFDELVQEARTSTTHEPPTGPQDMDVLREIALQCARIVVMLEWQQERHRLLSVSRARWGEFKALKIATAAAVPVAEGLGRWALNARHQLKEIQRRDREKEYHRSRV